MITKFTVLDSNLVSISILDSFNEELKLILESIDSGTIFSSGLYSKADFRNLLESFVKGQRGSLGKTKKEGSWSIVPNDTDMTSDARVDFIFMPTYLVTAILSRIFCDYPDIAKSITGYTNALKKGMKFCSYRDLQGHGYEGDAGAAEALTILSIGKVPWLLENNKDFCPELLKSIQNVVKNMKSRLDSGTASDEWGCSLQEEFSSALETLYIKNDKETYEALKNADNDKELIKEEDLKW